MKCRFCQSDIPDKSKLCKECKFYQSKFRNGLRGTALYLGGIVALLVLVGAAVVHGIDRYNELQARYYGAVGLKVIAARNDGDVTIENTGLRDIFVSSIIFHSDQQKDVRPINRIIRGGELQTYERTFAPGEQREWRCIKGEIAKALMARECLVENQRYIFFTNGHPDLTGHFDLEKTHAIIDGTATVAYRPAGESTNTDKVVECRVMIVEATNRNGEYSTAIVSEDQAEPIYHRVGRPPSTPVPPSELAPPDPVPPQPALEPLPKQ